MNARNAASRLAENWARQLEFLRASLARDPDAPQAWRWQIHERVLGYLLARYGRDSLRDWPRTEPPAAAALSPPLDRKTIEPRPAAILGEHLQRIAAANIVSGAAQRALEQRFERQLRWRKIGMTLVILLVMSGPFLLLWTIFLAPSCDPESFLAVSALVLCAALAAAWAWRRKAILSASTPRAPRDSFRA